MGEKLRPSRKLITDMYERVCRDSGHSLDAVRAMKLTADILHIHPLEVGYAMPSLQRAEEIAAASPSNPEPSNDTP